MRTFETQSRQNLFVTDRTLWSFTLTHLYLGYKHVLPRKCFILSDFLSQTGTTLSDFPRSREEGIHMCWQSRFLDLGGGIPWRSIVSKGTGSIIRGWYLLVCKTFWLSVAFGSFISAVRLEVNYLIIQLTVKYWLAQATRHNQWYSSGKKSFEKFVGKQVWPVRPVSEIVD